MRITVKNILEYIAAGETEENILAAYPVLEKEDIKACRQFASQMADHSFINYPLKAS